MFAGENGVVPSGRIMRETGSWGVMVTIGKKDDQEIIVNECGMFPPDEDTIMSDKLGSVGVSCGTTINMGNFESARIDCWCTMASPEDKVEESYDTCYKFVTGKISAYGKKMRDQRQ